MTRYLIDQSVVSRLNLPSDVVLLETDVYEDITSLFEDFFGQQEHPRFHLYEAPSAASLAAAVRQAGLSTDVIRPCEPGG